MGKFFIKNEQINGNKVIITGEDVNHIKNVLRLNVNNEIHVCNSETSENYICKIKNLPNKTTSDIECEIIKKIDNISEGNVILHIFQGIPKSDKIELIIQKGTELGVAEFIPVNFKRCVVKISGKDEIKKIDRWNKISEVAAKQCGRDIVPKVRNIEKVEQIGEEFKNYDLVLVAYELEDKNYIKNELLKIKKEKKNYKIAVVIGPEGGIEKSEVEILKSFGGRIISLGKRILRTETVAMQVSSIIMYELENSGGNNFGKS